MVGAELTHLSLEIIEGLYGQSALHHRLCPAWRQLVWSRLTIQQSDTHVMAVYNIYINKGRFKEASKG